MPSSQAGFPTVRLLSIDAFRGATIVGMILVNNPGDWSTVYAPLLHADWHGWTPTDLIFPVFLFIVGVSIALGLFLSGYPFGLFGARSFGRMPRISKHVRSLATKSVSDPG